MAELEKISYALGMSMANNFRSSGIKELDVDQFSAGLDAAFNGGDLKMTYDEAKTVIREFFTAMEQQMQVAAEAAAKVNEDAGRNHLEANAKRPEVITTPSGLQYEVLVEGNGPKPTAQSRVKVHYTGRLIDGTVFDSSVERGEPASFGVTQVIPGWVEALQMMTAGSKWRLHIPSNLAYGPQGAGGVIGPNSTLIFEVELLEVL